MLDINLWAVLLAAVLSFGLGGLWYSPVLFGQRWLEDSGFEEEKAYTPARVFGLSLVFCLASAGIFAHLLGPGPELDRALTLGLLVGVGLVSTSFAINYQFAARSTPLLLIDGGYHTCQFLLYGVVLALWH